MFSTCISPACCVLQYCRSVFSGDRRTILNVLAIHVCNFLETRKNRCIVKKHILVTVFYIKKKKKSLQNFCFAHFLGYVLIASFINQSRTDQRVGTKEKVEEGGKC